MNEIPKVVFSDSLTSADWGETTIAAGDEYRLMIHPVVLGAGERLFLAPLTIEPVSTTVFSGGAVAHVFAAHP
jgi:dihydrofolate reductase